jgi:hypothetical protein
VLTACNSRPLNVAQTEPAVFTEPCLESYSEPLSEDEPESGLVFLDLKIKVPNHVFAKHEPAHGTFLGAYIASDRATAGMAQFQEQTGVKHAIFAYTMHLGDEYPLRWVLDNISNLSSPFFTILPPKTGPVCNITLLEDFAKQAGLFNVPVFVNLFPICGGVTQTGGIAQAGGIAQTQENTRFVPSEYIAFFRRAYDIFARHAPNAALVWGVDSSVLPLAGHFFPGAEYVDWVNITIYDDIGPDGDFKDFFGSLDSFYDSFYCSFQGDIPLILSTAVSHYSMESNRHFPVQAAARIGYIYGKLAEYPEIKALIYRNYSDLSGNNTNGRGGIYRLNDSDVVINSYKEAASLPHFLSVIEHKPQGAIVGSTVLSTPYKAVMREFDFFIPVEVLTAGVQSAVTQSAGVQSAVTQSADGLEVIIDDKVFYPMWAVNQVLGIDFFVNLQEGFLVLQ